ncbi:UvrD-helicase domain-containing protein [Pseudoalteromonas sp. T1lg23B]|uniref:UvrD-helicase domain-containing protein n=1 Tax=Pseudoalteromonas sp. T1lg23B TaxID=2077097 RepID=UPI001319C904|nr:UvrD-helicase domain-containing protein [Pseudoalteromonas sp. T1lg23B]
MSVTVAHSEHTNDDFQRYWINQHHLRLINAIGKIEALLKNHYLSHSNLEVLQQSVAVLEQQWLSWKPSITLSPDLAQALYTLKELQQWQAFDIDAFRAMFIEYYASQYQHFFDNVERQPLTWAQRQACIIRDDRHLLLAGAGTGKTSVMIARAKFLVHCGAVQPEQILLLAYGTEAAKELKQRAGEGFECMTFHALGRLVIAQVEGKQPRLSTLTSDAKQRYRFVHDTLQALCFQPGYKELFAQFCIKECNIKPSGEMVEFISSSGCKPVITHITALLGVYKHVTALGQMKAVTSQHDELLKCLTPIATEYQSYLASEGAIDFEDMIAKAIAYIETGHFSAPWQHIMVDEFQDLSPIRAKLLKALLRGENKRYLFAVGDDWQSIYRFSGADITLTTQFDKHFGDAAITALDKTFRYPQDILDISSTFVCSNPAQLKKRVKSARKSAVPALLVETIASSELEALEKVLERLNAQGEASVLLLARFHKMLPSRERLSDLRSKFNLLDIRVMTFHAAKGKEADYAIMMGLYEGSTGFPTSRAIQPLMDAMLPSRETFPFAEERRLFYVALTRAKQQTFVLKPQENACRFLAELEVGSNTK